MPRRAITEKDDTFLRIKYGEHYVTRIVERWHDKNDLEELTPLEKEVCLTWLQKIAGIHKEEL